MKIIFYWIAFIFSIAFLWATNQKKFQSEIELLVVSSTYDKQQYQIPGITWEASRKIFEEKIKSLETATGNPDSIDLNEILKWKLWFAKYRFWNGEFKQFVDDINSIKNMIKQNHSSDKYIISINIEDDLIAIEKIYNDNIKNEQDRKFGNLYIKIRNEDISQKSKVVYSDGKPVRITLKSPKSGLDRLQKRRLEYLNKTWFKDLSKSDSKMRLGFFTHTDSIEKTYLVNNEPLTEGYVLTIPDLPILTDEQEYIFIFEDGNEIKKRYRKKFYSRNYDKELLEISYMDGWYLDPAPAPGEIEIRLPASSYAVKTNAGTIGKNQDTKYEIEIRNVLSLGSEKTIDPMEKPVIKKDNKPYYIYYVPHKENVKLKVVVNKMPHKESKFRKFLIYGVIIIGVGGYYAQ